MRTLRGANIVALLIGMSLFSMFFFISLYMQQVLGYSALKTGVAYLPLALVIIFSAGGASRLVTRIGFKIDARSSACSSSPPACSGSRRSRRTAGRTSATCSFPSLLAAVGPRLRLRAGDDRRRDGDPPRPGGPRVGARQHRPAGRRRARPGDPRRGRQRRRRATPSPTACATARSRSPRASRTRSSSAPGSPSLGADPRRDADLLARRARARRGRRAAGDAAAAAASPRRLARARLLACWGRARAVLDLRLLRLQRRAPTRRTWQAAEAVGRGARAARRAPRLRRRQGRDDGRAWPTPRAPRAARSSASSRRRSSTSRSATPGLDDLRVVGSMHERKALMAELADAFIALPGRDRHARGALRGLHLGAARHPRASRSGCSTSPATTSRSVAFLDHAVQRALPAPARRARCWRSATTSTTCSRAFDGVASRPAVHKWIDLDQT